MEQYENKVMLQGKILVKRISKKVGSFILETTISPDKKRRNSIRVMVFSESLMKELEHYESGDFVSVTATMQSYRGEKKNKNPRQSVVARAIAPAESRLQKEFHTEHGNLYDKINEVKIAGTIVGLSDTPKGKMKYIMVRTVTGGRMNHILMKAYVNEYTKEILESFKIGDGIFAIGSIQVAANKSKAGKTKFRENLIAMEFTAA